MHRRWGLEPGVYSVILNKNTVGFMWLSCRGDCRCGENPHLSLQMSQGDKMKTLRMTDHSNQLDLAVASKIVSSLGFCTFSKSGSCRWVGAVPLTTSCSAWRIKIDKCSHKLLKLAMRLGLSFNNSIQLIPKQNPNPALGNWPYQYGHFLLILLKSNNFRA